MLDDIIERIKELPEEERISAINEIKLKLHEVSPFKTEPVDCVVWVPAGDVAANDYNPNMVAPPEMELLRTSIETDGYTQPIVTWENNGGFEVIDGFHRNRVGKECEGVKRRIKGYLPVTIVNTNSTERNNRIASTIRHNRARGKHTIEGMSDIVLELKNRNWTNERISKELGMDQDEILRLCQITGLESLFTDQEFSKAWDIEDYDPCFDMLDDEDEIDGESEGFRAANTNDPERIFHTHDKWECHKAGFYATTFNGKTKDECEKAYAYFLSNTEKFSEALEHVITEWKNSCEHYLTNKSMNRIAWLGQAAMCYATGIPATFRGGFYLLSDEQQHEANKTALIYLNRWLREHNMKELSLEDAMSGKQVDLY